MYSGVPKSETDLTRGVFGVSATRSSVGLEITIGGSGFSA